MKRIHVVLLFAGLLWACSEEVEPQPDAIIIEGDCSSPITGDVTQPVDMTQADAQDDPITSEDVTDLGVTDSATDPSAEPTASYLMSPPSATVLLGGEQQFVVTNDEGIPLDRDDISFYLSQSESSPFALGRIDEDGLFTAPTAMPSPPTIDLAAMIGDDPPVIVWATVTLQMGNVADVGADLPWPATVIDLDIDPLDSDHLFVVSDSPDSPLTLFESTDRGLSWEMRPEDWNWGVRSVVFAGAGTAYLVRYHTSDSPSVMSSQDSGVTFVPADGDDPATSLPAPVPPHPNPCDTTDAYWAEVIAVHPENPDNVFVGGECCIPLAQRHPQTPVDMMSVRTCIFESVDRGSTWQETNPSAAAFDFSAAGTTYSYDAEGHQIGRTNFGGEKVLPWMTLSQLDVVMDGDNHLLVLSSQGNGVMLSRDGGVNFDWIMPSDVTQSVNGFVVYEDPGGGIPPCDYCSGTTGDPLQIGMLVASTSHSVQRAECFCAVEGGYGPAFDPFYDFDAHPPMAHIGFQWHWLGLAEGLTDITFHSIALHPAPPGGEQWVYIGGHLSGAIQRTTDGGNNWDHVIDSLFGIPISRMAISAEDPPTLFAGTIGRGGIFRFTP